MVNPVFRYGTLAFLIVFPAFFACHAAQTVQNQGDSPPIDTRGLTSPRETMNTFLNAMADVEKGIAEAYRKAASTLDLDGISSFVRTEKAQDIAWTLLEILDRSGPVVVKNIPRKIRGNVFVYKQFTSGDIALERRPDGRWLFGSDTIQALPSILDEIPDLTQSTAVQENGQTHLPWHLRLRTQLPDQLKDQWLFLENWQWIGLLLIVVLGSVFDKAITQLMRGVVRIWRKRGHMAELWFLSDNWLRPVGLLVMAGFWWIGINSLGLNPAALLVLLVAVKLMAGLSGIWAAFRLVDFASAYLQHKARSSQNKLDDVLVPLFRKSLKVFFTLAGVLFIASKLNLNISGLVAGLGLGGLAFALAAKDMVQNLFGSLTVLLDQSFHVGDWVVIGDVEGTVEEVGLRSTRIRTFYNSELILPNSTLITASIDNMGKRKYRRFKCDLSVTYQTPPEKIEAFCEAIRELVRLHPHIRKDYFQVYLNKLSASSLDILVYVFWEAPDWGTELRERHRFLIDVLRIAELLKIEFAYPTQTIHWKREEASEAADELTPDRMNHEAILRDAHAAARSIMGQTIDPIANPHSSSIDRLV